MKAMQKKKLSKHVFISIVSVLLCVLIGLTSYGFYLDSVVRTQAYSYFFTTEKTSSTASNVHKITIGKLVGYAYTPSHATKTVVYYGGSGSIAYNNAIQMSKLMPDYNIVCVDYPGVQDSQGTMTLSTMKASAKAAYDYAAKTYGSDVTVMGYSFGTGIAAYLASVRTASKLILMAPYIDGVALYNTEVNVFHGLWSAFVTQNIDTKAYASKVTCETLIITSTGDTCLPSSQSYALAKYFHGNATVTCFKGIAHSQYKQTASVMNKVNQFVGA